MKRAILLLLVVLMFVGVLQSSASGHDFPGCVYVDNPTRAHHTDCPETQFRFGARFKDHSMKFANLPGILVYDTRLPTSFAYANLRGATIFNMMGSASFHRTHLNNAALTDMWWTSGINLSGADLRGADLEGSSLTNANMRNANLEGAKRLGKHNIRGVRWENTICPDGSNSDSHSHTCRGHIRPR